jgi:hypothetical protein
MDANGSFYSVAQDGTLLRFASCMAGPSEKKLLDADALPEELPVAVSGSSVFTVAPTKAGGIEIGGTQSFGPPRQIELLPRGLESAMYVAVAARGDDVAALWYGTTTAGHVSDSGFAGDFNVYVAILHHFWNSPSVAVFQITTSPVHHGAICRNGISCGSASRGPGDYFDIAIDRWGGVDAVYAADTGTQGTYLEHLPPNLVAR